MCTNVFIVRGEEQVPRSSPHSLSSSEKGMWVQMGRTGHLRWVSCQDKKIKPPQFHQMFPWCTLLVCRIRRPHACLLNLLPRSASVPPSPTFPSVFLLFYHLMQLPLLHGRANHTSEETTASYSLAHSSGQTVLCRRGISILAMPMPKYLSRFSHPL